MTSVNKLISCLLETWLDRYQDKTSQTNKVKKHYDGFPTLNFEWMFSEMVEHLSPREKNRQDARRVPVSLFPPCNHWRASK